MQAFEMMFEKKKEPENPIVLSFGFVIDKSNFFL